MKQPKEVLYGKMAMQQLIIIEILANQIMQETKIILLFYLVVAGTISLMEVHKEGLQSGADFSIGTTTNIFTITDLAGNSVMCSFDVTVDATTLNVTNYKLEKSISLVPNPTKNSITIINNGVITLESISILDLDGRLLKSHNNATIVDNKINVSNLSAGLYLIKIRDIN